jgi:predicted site-specific integrase-resolvase
MPIDQTPALEPLLTAAEVKAALQIGASTLQGLVTRGGLPCVRLPSGVMRFESAKVRDWLAGRTSAGTLADVSQ